MKCVPFIMFHSTLFIFFFSNLNQWNIITYHFIPLVIINPNICQSFTRMINIYFYFEINIFKKVYLTFIRWYFDIKDIVLSYEYYYFYILFMITASQYSITNFTPLFKMVLFLHHLILQGHTFTSEMIPQWPILCI